MQLMSWTILNRCFFVVAIPLWDAVLSSMNMCLTLPPWSVPPSDQWLKRKVDDVLH